MEHYKRKYDIIDVVKWMGDNIKEIVDFCGVENIAYFYIERENNKEIINYINNDRSFDYIKLYLKLNGLKYVPINNYIIKENNKLLICNENYLNEYYKRIF